MTPDGKFIVKIPLGLRGLKPFEQFVVCTKTVFWTLNHLVSNESIDPNDPPLLWRKILECFHQKP